MGLLVTCITKSGGNELEHIAHIEGAGWRYTVAQAIPRIRADATAFYTGKRHQRAVRASSHEGGGEYLRTTPDHVFSDNLLALPACSRGVVVASVAGNP